MIQKQISLPVVEGFPNKPAAKPADWRLIADRAEQFLMDPSNGVLKTDSRDLKYFTAFLEGKSKELITYGCVVAGKVLRGEDVEELLPTLPEFFSDSWGVFLNSPGGDVIEYWYLFDVNALADAIIKLKLKDNPGVMLKWRHSTERLIQLAHKLNYDFNAQGYVFRKDESFTNRNEFRQPDAIAGYAYVMTFTYEAFKDERYLEEAKSAMERYQSFERNPWYEIPSGAMAGLAAARLNSRGETFDLERILNFIFDKEAGSLLTGTWGEKEINGLMIGWRGFSREEAMSSAYSMETMIVLPYVLPVVRYYPEYARSIGKYALNAAANTSLFFSEYLSPEHQSRPDLKPEIPYERLCREQEGRSPYGTGDCEGHKSVYGGGFALWWGAIISPTNEEYILRFDLVKSDFLADNAYPSYLFYNPYGEERTVELDLGGDKTDVYELTSHRFLSQDAAGKKEISIPSDSAVVIVMVPAGGEKSLEDGRLAINGVVVDYCASGR